MITENEKCPSTTKEALEMWDHGETIAAFTVESEGATQQQLYAAAFEMIRVGLAGRSLRTADLPYLALLSKREKDVAHSIAAVAIDKGWASMVVQHVSSGHIAKISIRKQ